MKKALLILLAMTMILSIFAVLPLGASAAAPTTGIKLEDGDYYETRPKSLMLPSTYEATVYFPALQHDRGGVIIGTYSENKTPLFNFEVYENGVPRIYVNANDSAVTNYDIKFDKVDLFNGKLTHVAITVDHAAGVWSCYVDGALKQTVKAPAPKPFLITNKIRLGGDHREGNVQYFKGIIHDVALYRDVRTAEEIASDATAATFNKDDLICAYDLSASPITTPPTNVICAADSGIDFKFYSNWIRDLPEPENYAYSFALIGDIQSLTFYYPEKLPVLFDWIRDNAESKKIKFAVGLGDITHRNQATEYQLVNRMYDKLKGVVPFSIIRGNHDKAGGMYEQFITLTRYRDQITGSFDYTMRNTYKIIEVGEVKYMFMNLDFLLKDDVIAWANDIIAQNKDCRVIVSTHIYMNSSGNYYTLTGNSGIGTKHGCENNGEGLWDKLLSRHENIIMMICGHNPTDNIYHRTKKGVNGNKVVELLVDPQDTDQVYNGTGLVAMLYFSEDGRNVEVQYYSTIKQAFFKKNNQFKLTIDVPESTIPETTPAETTPAATTPAETTPAGSETPEVTTPIDSETGNNTTEIPEDTTPAEIVPAITDPVDNGGCNATLLPSALLLTLAVAGVALIKKKKE